MLAAVPHRRRHEDRRTRDHLARARIVFGSGNPAFDGDGPGKLWPYPLVAAMYIVAAVTLMLTRRVHFDSPAT